MKKHLFILFVLLSVSISAQFKDPVFETEKPKDGIMNNSSNSLFGFINPDNFSMHHSIGLSYSTIGNYGTSLATYTNSMMYKFSDNMNIQMDASFVTVVLHLIIDLGKMYQSQFSTEMCQITFTIHSTDTMVSIVIRLMIDFSVPVTIPLCINNRKV